MEAVQVPADGQGALDADRLDLGCRARRRGEDRAPLQSGLRDGREVHPDAGTLRPAPPEGDQGMDSHEAGEAG